MVKPAYIFNEVDFRNTDCNPAVPPKPPMLCPITNEQRFIDLGMEILPPETKDVFLAI
jgi:hypothetical protein